MFFLSTYFAGAMHAYTLWQAIATLFKEQLLFLRLWHMRDHIVICGLIRKGWLLAAGFLEQGYHVVVAAQSSGSVMPQRAMYCAGLCVPSTKLSWRQDWRFTECLS